LKKREEEMKKQKEDTNTFRDDEKFYDDTNTANTVTSQATTVKVSQVIEEQKKYEPKPRALGMNDYKKFKFIEKIEAKYTFGDYLGQGAFGKVCKCVLNDTGNQFAIKIMQKEMVKKRKVFLTLLENELSILGSKCHPKIIRIVDLLEDNSNYYIVSEIVEGGELFKRL
jgi:serine/threonine protein kinase